MKLTKTYVFSCLETPGIKHIRRVITRNGGVYHECYRYPGVYWIATYRTVEGMTKATETLAEWENKFTRAYNTPEDIEKFDMLIDPKTYGDTEDDPVNCFMRDIWIDEPRRLYRPRHPIAE